VRTDSWLLLLPPNRMDIYGPPSPPPLPSSPEAAAGTDRSPVVLRPPLSSLPALVDAAVSNIKLHMYQVPPDLVDVMDLKLKVTCTQSRKKHRWIDLEHQLWRSLPQEVWTDDPAAASFFVVPHAFIAHQCISRISLTRNYVWSGMARFFEYIHYASPYYNRSGGRDHLATWIFENGPLCDCRLREIMRNETLAFRMLMSFVKVGYFGHRDEAMFGWRRGVDIAMPQWGAVPASPGPQPTWQEVVSAPKYSFGFQGSFWGQRVGCPALAKGNASENPLDASHYCECSPGIREWLHVYLKSHCNSSNTTTSRCVGTSGAMGSFWFALCPAAWACWSSRLYHAIDRLVVPALMANGAIQPFEDILDWRSFAVKLDTVPLMSDNTSQLDWLHREALLVHRHCARCQECYDCTRLPLVRKVQRLVSVRTWFRYNSSSPYSASGLFMLELHCRFYHLQHAGDGVCRRYHSRDERESLAGRNHRRHIGSPASD
jgi:hypothetical protein